MTPSTLKTADVTILCHPGEPRSGLIRDRVQDMIKKGMTLEQIKAAKPTMDFDPEYGRQPGATAKFVEAVYRSLKTGTTLKEKK